MIQHNANYVVLVQNRGTNNMGKLNIFGIGKKTKELKPSDIQLEIDKKEKSINQIEDELKKADVLIEGNEVIQEKEYNAKKETNQSK